jgi:hypothetical protein
MVSLQDLAERVTYAFADLAGAFGGSHRYVFAGLHDSGTRGGASIDRM